MSNLFGPQRDGLATRAPVSSPSTQARDDKLLAYIVAHQRETGGTSPSFREMCAASGMRSKATIHRALTRLERRDKIRVLWHRARAIEVLNPQLFPKPAWIPLVVPGPGTQYYVARTMPGCDMWLEPMK